MTAAMAAAAPLIDTDQVTINLNHASHRHAEQRHFAALPGNQRIDAGGGNDTMTFGFRLTDATVT